MAKGLQKQIESMDIHELMDKFDAPRIVLQSPAAPAAAPVILAIAAVQTDAAPLAEAAANVEEEESSQKLSRSAESSSVSPAKSNDEEEVVATAELATPLSPPTPPAPPAPPAIAHSTTAPPAIVKNAATPKAIARNEAAPRPDWIDETPKRTGYTRRDLIVTDEYESIDECYQAADVYLMLKTYEHLMELIGRPRYGNTQPSITFTSNTILVDGQVISAANDHRSVDDNRLDQLNDLGIGIDYVRREVVAKDPKDNESARIYRNHDSLGRPDEKTVHADRVYAGSRSGALAAMGSEQSARSDSRWSVWVRLRSSACSAWCAGF